MNCRKLFLIAACTISFAGTSHAQSSTSGYFMESYAYRHELNPAFDTEKGYFAFPVLGNMNFGVNANFGLDQIFYPNSNGSLDLFTADRVNAAEFLGKLKDENIYTGGTKIQLLGAGFHSFGGYTTIGVSAYASTNMLLPYELFDFAKNTTNKNYQIDEMNMMAQSYAEIAFGHSRRIGDKLRVGAKAKILIGAGRVDAKLENFSFDLSPNKTWTAQGHASVESSVKGLIYKSVTKDYNDENRGQYQTIDDVDFESPGPSGLGMAFDFGAEYDMSDIVEGLKVSAAVTDLGFINWNNNLLAENNGSYKFQFDGFKNIQVKDGPGVSFDDQADALVDDLKNLTNLQDKGDQGSRTTGLATTINVGAEYALPVYNKLRFGLLSTTRVDGKYTCNEERLSVNISPLKWIEANANVGVGTYGASFGCMLNLHGKAGSFFLATNCLGSKLSKQGIPLTSRASVMLGYNFNLTTRKGK